MSSHTLNISLIQSNLHWESPAANRAMFEEKISPLKGNTDIIVLPEMFSTGFTMNTSENAELMNLHTHKWMKQIADYTGAVVTGSMIVQEGNNYYNRLLWISPEGPSQGYDKKHLFRMAEEHHHFSPGQSRLITHLKGWKVCPMICYDLRFPEWARNRYNHQTGSLDYDLLLYVANWPAARERAWDTLLRARAIENLCYTAGVNRTGTDGNGIVYSGHTAVYDFTGETLAFTDKEEVMTITLKKESLDNYRAKFPAFLDAQG